MQHPGGKRQVSAPLTAFWEGADSTSLHPTSLGAGVAAQGRTQLLPKPVSLSQACLEPLGWQHPPGPFARQGSVLTSGYRRGTETQKVKC